MTYAPPDDQSGSALDTFYFKIRDDGGTDDDGIDTDPFAKAFTFDVLEA